MWFKRKPQPAPAPRITLGTAATRSGSQPLAFTLSQLRTHKLVRGVSGSGKSVFLQSLALGMLSLREPYSLIDPHGDLGIGILAYLHDTGFFADEQAYSRLIYCKFSRTDYAVAFNILNQPRYDSYTLAAHVHEAIMRAFPSDSSTPLLSSILLPSLVVLIQHRLPITMLLRLLTDKEWRDELLDAIADPIILSFFHDRYDAWGKGATIESVARRLQLLTFSPVLRFCLGQQANVLDLRTLMDQGATLVMDLGGLDSDTARLLACLLTVFYEKAALSREAIEPQFRTPHHLLIDEAPTVAASSGAAFAHLLEQTRKYHLFLCLAHQTMGQFDASLHGSLANTHVEICFRQSEQDAKASAHRFTHLAPDYYDQRQQNPKLHSPADLQATTALKLEQLKTGQALVRHGDTITQMQTLHIPPSRSTRADIQAILDEYARRYATPVAQLRSEDRSDYRDARQRAQEADHVRWFDEAAG